MSHPFRVPTDGSFQLASVASDDDHFSVGDKGDNKDEVKKLSKSIEDLQDILYANKKHRVLLVLQGSDTSGKDGTTKKVFKYCDPLGIKTHAFKAPTEAELAHDFLWRVHSKVPGDGEIAVFNRSHYEDVLITSVNEWITEDECHRRYAHINAFEKLLAETGTTIIKCMLHIGFETQRERLQARIDNPDKHWKFSTGDLDKRTQWSKYQYAYEQMLKHTSTEHAPWYVIPADNKWHRNVAVAKLLHQTLKDLDLSYPEPNPEYYDLVIE